jgi:hypothetical protein
MLLSRFQAALRSGLLLLVCPLILGCAFRKPAAFSLFGVEPGTALYALSREALAGRIDFAKDETLNFEFAPPLLVPRDYSLELDYRFFAAGEDPPDPARYQMILEYEGGAWELPWDGAFLGFEERPGGIRYVVPLPPGPLRGFRLIGRVRAAQGAEAQAAGDASGNARTAAEDASRPVFELEALGLCPRWFGFAWEGRRLRLTPFVFIDREAGGLPGALLIEPPLEYRSPRAVELSLGGIQGEIRLEAGNLRLRYQPPAGEALSPAAASPGGLAPAKVGDLVVPPGLLGTQPYPAAVFGAASSGAVPGAASPAAVLGATPVRSMEIAVPTNRPFPGSPIPADPGIILDYPLKAWRDRRYEVFQWPAFPQVLIFDTADYPVQDRLFKRLAFFVEKAGYQGRLLPDGEMEDLHGWNAHDYRAEDLARFFAQAEQEAFPLSAEERELQGILLENGILRRRGGEDPPDAPAILPGIGAALSISRQSADYLRSRFMVHEGFHGLYFLDEDFREFSLRRWENLDAGAKRFLRSYFDSQRYALEAPYLMANEFMAYCLQQPVSQAGRYFGESLAALIDDNSWRRAVLPPAETTAQGTRVWPGLARIFSREAEAFSAYVQGRWGFAAGRVRSVILEGPE